MIKISVDEAYAFDYYSILDLKYNSGYIPLSVLEVTKNDLIDSLGVEKVEAILKSEEYADLYAANRLTFEAVDKAKEDKVAASYVDKCNYKRTLSKRALQQKHFNNEISEVKIGYERLK